MTKFERIARLGLWPRVLGADLAALYCGVSKTWFYRKVSDGIYPRPFENGGLVQWDREDLDAAIEALKQNNGCSASRQAVKVTGDDIGRALDEWTPENSAVS